LIHCMRRYGTDVDMYGGEMFSRPLGDDAELRPLEQGGVLYRVFDPAQGVCEIGVWLAPEVRGRGLITRAGRILIDWAFDVRGMTRVTWLCDPRNQPSIAAARRLGFTHEGTHRKALYFDGEHRDAQVWAIIA
jgi:ribosomal-protein-serine acetyltransferase